MFLPTIKTKGKIYRGRFASIDIQKSHPQSLKTNYKKVIISTFFPGPTFLLINYRLFPQITCVKMVLNLYMDKSHDKGNDW